jgi:hypothetical protein
MSREIVLNLPEDIVELMNEQCLQSFQQQRALEEQLAELSALKKTDSLSKVITLAATVDNLTCTQELQQQLSESIQTNTRDLVRQLDVSTVL